MDQAALKADLSYDPETGVFVRLPRGRERFSTENSYKVWNARYAGQVAGTVSPFGYRSIRFGDRPQKAHRLAVLYMTGEWPGHEVDHINGNRDDNRWCNLRCVTRQENMQNKRPYRSNSSGLMGVSWRKDNQRWIALETVMGKRRSLGCFPTLLDAAAARISALNKSEYHGNHGAIAA